MASLGAALRGFLPDILSPLQGPTTTTIYALRPSTLLPIEPLVDILPAVTPNRQALDVTDTVTKRRTYNVTRVPLQGGSTITTGVHKNLDQMTVTGVIAGAPQLALAGSIGVLTTLAQLDSTGTASAITTNWATTPGFPPPRRDFLQVAMLELLADKRFPVMIVTPERAMPRAFITDITTINSPQLGNSTEVQISLIEARLVEPKFTKALSDLDEILGGNGETVEAGGQPASTFGGSVSGLG